MRRGLAWAAAVIGAATVMAPGRLADELSEDHWLSHAEVLYPVVLAAVALTVAFAHGLVSQRWAVTALVLFFVLGLVAGGVSYYAGYYAALVLGFAIAAGEPLPPPDPADDRMSRPMPRGDRDTF